MRALDVTGQRYGRLIAIRREPGKGNPWLWRCDCGTEIIRAVIIVRSGGIKSCGCLLADLNRSRAIHGHRSGRKYTPTLSSYEHAKARVSNPTNPKWPTYGGRGIIMCDRWLAGFPNFLEDMGEAPAGYTIERIDNDGPYSPENCRWASKADQAKNKTTTLWVEHNGERMCLADYARAMNIGYFKAHNQLKTQRRREAKLLTSHGTPVALETGL